MRFFLICAIFNLLSRVDGFIASEDQIHTAACYNVTNNLSASCPNGTVIAVYEFDYGFKNKSSPCTASECCDYQEGDCLQPSTDHVNVKDGFSGKETGQISTSNAVANGTCENDTYDPTSTFNLLKYLCIPENRTWVIGDSVAVNVTSELPVYIESLNYPSGMPSGSLGTCSLEAFSATQIKLYTLHVEMNVAQSLGVFDDSRGLLATINSTTAGYNYIAEETLNTTYVNISLFNNDPSSVGKFWIGFKATSDDTMLNLNCPARPRIFFIGCGNVSAPEGTIVVYTDDTAYDSIATTSCAEGYVKDGGDETRKCQANNTWSGEPYTCMRAPACQDLPPITNGAFNVSDQPIIDGSTAVYSCDDGYTLQGDQTRTCTEGSGWNGTQPTCVKKCQELSPPPHGKITTSDGNVGDSVEYSCDEGYALNVQNATRVCTEDGTWTGDTPVCEIKACEALPQITNGEVTVNNQPITDGSTAVYSCDVGYTLQGETTRTCTEDSVWTGTQPTCAKIITCNDPPQIINGAVTVNNQPITDGSTAVYSCNDSYKLQGDTMRTCTEGSGWTGTQPTCDKTNCTGINAPQNGDVAVTGTTATFTCKEGFTLEGNNNQLVCEVGSQKPDNTPKCTQGGTKEPQTNDDATALVIVVPILLVIILGLILVIIYQKGYLTRPKHQLLIEEGKPDDGNNKKDDIQCQSMSTLMTKDETEKVKESSETTKGDTKCPIANAEGIDLDHPEKNAEETKAASQDKESGDAGSGDKSDQLQQKEASSDGKESGDSKKAEDSSHDDKATKPDAATNQEKTDQKPSDTKDTDLIDFGGTIHSADTTETPKEEGSKETETDKSTDETKEGSPVQSNKVYENVLKTHVTLPNDAVQNESNEITTQHAQKEEETVNNALNDNNATDNTSENKKIDDKTE